MHRRGTVSKSEASCASTEPSTKIGGTEMADQLTGGCYCGGVRYRLDGPRRDIIGCHCSQCRKTSGHFAAMTSVLKEKLTLLSDETLTWFQSSESVRRGFCNRCGGNLFFDPAEKPTISVTAGTLDLTTGLRMTRHIFVEDRSDYYDIPAD